MSAISNRSAAAPVAPAVSAAPSMVYRPDPDRGSEPDWLMPAERGRCWMEEARNRWPYRCLPLAIANAHGWWVLCQEAFTLEWRGDPEGHGVTVNGTGPWSSCVKPGPKSHFGEGIVTFEMRGRIETSPGWGLWITGPPNGFKHGLQPMTAFVRTDRLKYTFTMNWKFTHVGTASFAAGEPFCHFFPLPYGYMEDVEPMISPDVPEHKGVERRMAAERGVNRDPMKRYIRGLDMDDNRLWPDVHTTLKLRPFT